MNQYQFRKAVASFCERNRIHNSFGVNESQLVNHGEFVDIQPSNPLAY